MPTSLGALPVLITETQALPWEDRNIGWIQKAFEEINAWKAVAAHQPIQALCLFRWPRNPGDPPGWSISNWPRLLDDLRAALQNNYRVRWPTAQPQPVPAPVPKPQPVPAAQPIPAMQPHHVYVVQSGDTLSAIAKKFGVTLDSLVAANQIVNPNLIRPGQQLTIPSGGALAFTVSFAPSAEAPQPETPVCKRRRTAGAGAAKSGAVENARPQSRDRVVFEKAETVNYNLDTDEHPGPPHYGDSSPGRAHDSNFG